MNFKLIKPGTYAISVAGILALAVGTYTGNGGFQLAGALFLAIALVVGLNQATAEDGDR